ncbi:hypothetical protein [Streptomyces sp. WMMC897]|uniref:hypothetical protein n=1 Tax=Streptomyces sp. WMMC897 TaxID=3014782 RepID=UPI0022B6144A|nr:hypothetical protein [Streptomyces sp. WMMC897]MCZ7413065.1 hypothetical protein [Streptomyces sp. WMMC897]MCZ7415463.1 hypothetical protein [Streptomyces sp. WMMC897]
MTTAEHLAAYRDDLHAQGFEADLVRDLILDLARRQHEDVGVSVPQPADTTP